MLQYLLEADLVARIGIRINVSNFYVANYVRTILLAFIPIFQFFLVRLYKGHGP